MTILAVLNDKKELKKLSGMIGRLRPEVEVLCCESSPEALALAREQEVDDAFMGTELAEMGGGGLGQ